MNQTLADRYELLGVLGRGGMGVVYRATDRMLDRVVAVKILPGETAGDPSAVARFEREARAAAALSDPNVVGIFDIGRDGDTRFIVMEYVPGQSLAQLIRAQGRLPVARAVSVAAQVASALGAAHRAGIVHRDVKPGNVMVDDAGQVKVLDFGIARGLAGTSLTRTTIVLGSAPYMAPEVTRGEQADARSDIYSLGCLLYELLTGRPPFTGELAAAIMHQHNTARPRPVRELAAGVTPALDALVMRMLAKRPSERPQSAEEVARALATVLDRSAVGAAGAPPAFVVHRSRSRVWAWAGGLAAAAVVAILAFGALGSSGPSQHRPAATTTTNKHVHTTPTTTPTTTTTTPATTTPPAGGGGPAAAQGPADKHGEGPKPKPEKPPKPPKHDHGH